MFRAHGFRFFFCSSVGFEPIHVHVEGKGAIGKWWVERGRWALRRGFAAGDVPKIERELRTQR
ncbi:MAG: DUF4160 domain-containing protein [Phycisphaerales bacterium]|nr:DUF4160 domain-containing protein [Phycisphaerales bacterium]